MDFESSAFAIALMVALVALCGLLLFDAMRKRRNQRSGLEDAEVLAERLQTELPPEEYTVLRDVAVMTKMGKSTVDYLIVSVYGIFLIEYRAFVKQIYYNEFQHKWGVLARVRETPFTNPLWQAKVHALAVSAVVGEKPGLTYFPMAAFPNIDELNDRSVGYEPQGFIGLVDGVVPWIKQQTEVQLTPEEVKAVAELIQVTAEQVAEAEEPADAAGANAEDGPKRMPAEYEALLINPNAPKTVYRNAYGDEISEAEYFARQDAMEQGYHADSVVFDLDEGEWVIDEELSEKLIAEMEAKSAQQQEQDEEQHHFAFMNKKKQLDVTELAAEAKATVLGGAAEAAAPETSDETEALEDEQE